MRGAISSDFFPGLLAALVVFLAVFPVQGGRVAGRLQFVGGFGWPALPKWLSLGIVFLLAFLIMAAIAQGVGRVFVRFPPLEAYRWDILGSILGIAAFSVLSFLHASPFVWGMIAAAIVVAVGAARRAMHLVPLAVAVVVLGVLSFAPDTLWSPYYRVTTRAGVDDGTVSINVNGRPHQRIMPLALMEETQAHRFEPYRHAPANPLTDVLIIGAGSGNDVTIALAKGAEHIDAVEIDPLLYRLGRDRHPDHPYQDPRVSVHIEDGRSFLHDTDRRYDLVLYAIPDSLTVLAGQSSLRLESYLLTREAMQEVRDHLKPNGVISMYHYYLPVVVDRYADALTGVFGDPPCLELAAGSGPRPRTVLTASMRPGDLVCDERWSRPAELPAPVTDDHPFAYLVGHGIPGFYLVTLLAILLGSLVAVRLSAGPFAQMRPYVDLFFMGAAFLLLETSNVVRFALLFGTTWFVNALVFAGILVSVFLAIEVARRVRFRHPARLYVPLFARGGARVGGAARVAARARLRPEVLGRRRPRLHPGLHREPGVRGPVPRGRGVGHRVRDEPPRRDRRRRARVRGARDRLPSAADRRGDPVCGGVPDGSIASHRRAEPGGRERGGGDLGHADRHGRHRLWGSRGLAGVAASDRDGEQPESPDAAEEPEPSADERDQREEAEDDPAAQERHEPGLCGAQQPAPEADDRDDVAERVQERQREQREDAEWDAHQGDEEEHRPDRQEEVQPEAPPDRRADAGGRGLADGGEDPRGEREEQQAEDQDRGRVADPPPDAPVEARRDIEVEPGDHVGLIPPDRGAFLDLGRGPRHEVATDLGAGADHHVTVEDDHVLLDGSRDLRVAVEDDEGLADGPVHLRRAVEDDRGIDGVVGRDEELTRQHDLIPVGGIAILLGRCRSRAEGNENDGGADHGEQGAQQPPGPTAHDRVMPLAPHAGHSTRTRPIDRGKNPTVPAERFPLPSQPNDPRRRRYGVRGPIKRIGEERALTGRGIRARRAKWSPLWAKAPLALVRYPGLLAAVVVGALLLALVAAAYPLFLSRSQGELLRAGVGDPTVERFGAGIFYSVTNVGFQEQRGGRLLAERLDEGFRRIAAEGPHLGPPIRFVRGAAALVTLPGEGDPESGPVSASIFSGTDADEHVDVLEGDGSDGAMIPDLIAEAVGVETGDLIQLNGKLTLRVGGVYRALYTQPRSGYWSPWSEQIYQQCPDCPAPPQFILVGPDEAVRLTRELSDQEERDVDYGWVAPLDGTPLDVDTARAVRNYADRMLGEVSDRNTRLGRLFACCGQDYVTGPGFFFDRRDTEFRSSMPLVLREMDRRAAAVEGPLRLLLIAGLSVAAAVVAAAAAFAVAGRRSEAALLHARGWGPVRFGVKSAVEAAIPIVLGAAAGLGLGAWSISVFGPAAPSAPSARTVSVTWAIAAAAAGLLVLGVVSGVSFIRTFEVHSLKRRLAWVPWEILAIVGALLVLSRLNSGGALIEDRRLDILRPSALLLAFPVLFVAGFATLAARLLVEVLRRTGSRSSDRSPVTYLTFHRLTGLPKLTVLLVGAAALCLGVFIDSQTMVRSLRATVDAKAGVFVGSDLQVMVDSNAPEQERFPLPITRATRVKYAGTLTPGDVPFDMVGIDPETIVGAAFWDDAFSDEPLDDLVARLPSESGPLPVLLVQGEGDPTGMAVGQGEVPIEVVGRATAFPGVSSDDPVLVVDADSLERRIDAGGNPLDRPSARSEYWIAGPTDEALASVAELEAFSLGTITADEVKDVPFIAATIDTFAMLNVLGLAAAVLVIGVLVVYLQARQRARTVSNVLSLRMGMRDGQARAALMLELAAMLLAAFVLGGVTGLVAGRLIAPLLDPLRVIPPPPLFEPPIAAIVWTLAGLIVVAVAGGWLVHRRAAAVDLGEVLRVAE